MIDKKVAVIGGGPAGMIACGRLKNRVSKVYLIEPNAFLGKKLRITGKGRCNISFTGDMEYFLSNVVTNPKFMMSSINNLDNYSLVDYVNSLGVKTKEERGNRVFLASDDASELTEALKRELKRLNELEDNVKLKISDMIIHNVEGYNQKGTHRDQG